MKRILVVEDDTNSQMMVLALERHGYDCRSAYSGTEAILYLDEIWDAVILALLVENPRRIFTKQNIYEAVWDDCYMGTDNTINVHISNIRKKMREVTEEEYIETVWGIGFKLCK